MYADINDGKCPLSDESDVNKLTVLLILQKIVKEFLPGQKIMNLVFIFDKSKE